MACTGPWLCPVFGNDDDRCVYVDPEELHPQSRLKSIITREQWSQGIRWGCSRETLICFISSQRYNQIITRGPITQEEVIAELDRDCIDIGLSIPTCDDELKRVCQKLVRHILEWPLLRKSMERTLKGGFTDISCSHSFFYMSFPKKVYLAKRPIASMLEERPVKEIMMYLSMEIAQWSEYDHNWNDAELISFLKSLNAEKVIDKLTDSGEDPFWFTSYDVGNLTHKNINTKIFNAIKLLIAEKNIQKLICKINDDMPNLDSVFGATPLQSLEQKVLEYTFEQNGYETYWNWTAPQISLRPIRFPTIWITPMKPSSRLEYQMIGYIQKKVSWQ